jgi:hypothetical protein
LRDGGAWWTRVRPSPAIGDEYAAALDAVCRRFGRLVALGGGLLLLVTLLALLVGASDGTGAVVVTAAVAAIAARWARGSSARPVTNSGRWRLGRPVPTAIHLSFPFPSRAGPSLAAPAHDWESGATGALEPLVPETWVPTSGVSSDQTGAPAVEGPSPSRHRRWGT